MAGLIQRGNKWYATFYVAGKNVRKKTDFNVKPTPRDGNKTAAQLKRLAQLAANHIEMVENHKESKKAAVDAFREAIGGSSCPTCAEYVAKWLPTQTKKRSYATCRHAIEVWMRLQPEETSLPLDVYNEAMAQDFVDARLNEVSGGTVSRDVTELSAMFNRAVRERLIDASPFKHVRLPAWAKMERQERQPFTPEQLNIIFTQFPQEWRDLVMTTLCLGGQRLGDMVTLKWNQVNEEYGLITLQTSKTSLPMRKPIIPLLANLLARRRAGCAGSTPFIFPFMAARYGQAGESTNKVSNDFHQLLVKHGILTPELMSLNDRRVPVSSEKNRRHRLSPLSFHSLRATSTTILFANHVPAEMVKHIVGHLDPEVERRHYFKPSAAHEAAELQRMVEAFLQIKDTDNSTPID